MKKIFLFLASLSFVPLSHALGSKLTSVILSTGTQQTGYIYISSAVFQGISTFTAHGVSILGTNSNDNANTGWVGESISSAATNATNFPTSTQEGDLAQIILSTGDWDISLLIIQSCNGATVTSFLGGIGTVAGNSFTGSVEGDNFTDAVPCTASASTSLYIPTWRATSSTTKTYYLKMKAAYTVATPTAIGRISARRVR